MKPVRLIISPSSPLSASCVKCPFTHISSGTPCVSSGTCGARCCGVRIILWVNTQSPFFAIFSRLPMRKNAYFSIMSRMSPIMARGTGRSSMVLRPGRAFITWGIMFTIIAIVPMPPSTSGFMAMLTLGVPFSTI